MDSSNIDGGINNIDARSSAAGGSGSYQEVLIASSMLNSNTTASPSLDTLPSYLPTFRSSSAAELPSSSSSPPHQGHPPPPPCKKRSRASRRTPTTVLTTDTSNFRAMVQEFTGFPSPPFPSSPSPFLPPPSFLSHNIHAAASAPLPNSLVYPLLNPAMNRVPHPNPLPSSQFGDLISLVAPSMLNSTTSLHPHHHHVHLGGGGGLPIWQGDQSSSGDRDHDQLRHEKRQKTSDGVQPWIHSSD